MTENLWCVKNVLMISCPLCLTAKTTEFCATEMKYFGQMQNRAYFLCPQCELRFLEPSMRMSPHDEKFRYDSHKNGEINENYLDFLRPVMRVSGDFLGLDAPLQVLDYGCGEGRPFQILFPHHWETSHYDPFYFPESSLLERKYDWITCTEVVEHFYHPARDWKTLVGLLKPGGLLSVMTGLYNDSIHFSDWWYIKDPTHVCFYSLQTMQWIADRYQLEMIYNKNNIVLFRT
tara:strand:- start:11035 stop:11730 length:696 start_codon:yes stop_codon:yes gene_type:complete